MITLGRIFGALTLLALAACGGGGGGGGGSGGFDGYRIPIAAGTGAALAGATVTVEGSGDSKPFTCSGTTDENGYITCDVPASYTPPFVITVNPADAKGGKIKTVVVSASKGTNPRAPVTPLTNLLIEADSVFYETAKVEEAKVRLTARKKQISDALANVFTEILGDKATNFDFLTDSSFAPGSNDGSDLLLDNISVSFENGKTFKVSLKKNANANVSFTANVDPKTSAVTPITVSSSDVVNFTTRKLTDFAGVYDIDVTFTSYNSNGSVSVETKTESVQLALNSDGTFDAPLRTTRWSGKYKLNDKKTSVKISGTVGGAGTLVGSIDNNFKMTLAYNTKGSGVNSGQTTKGSVVNTTFTHNAAQGSGGGNNAATKVLSDFAGTYTLNAQWKSDDGELGSGTGTVVIGSNGSVTSCSGGGIFVICTGSVALKNDGSGATFSLTAKSDYEGTRSATATGSVSNTFALSGSFNGTSKVDNVNGTFSGTFSGSIN